MHTDELEGLLPTEADVVFYEESQRGAERHWSGERDWGLPVDGGCGERTPDAGDGIRSPEFEGPRTRP